ncbi:MAG: tRNA (cytidine(34)-2'-O)-methyltransferase [Clostridiales bacterium]|jgi:tRNA (cytidine/uridine-2'-O-)-methyltransferase|nr:tRNA (cytidine(34)-2'-O)-methyltransferase [Clostridiales bacterium]
MNVVLLEPEIPMNTGNIGRTCVCAGAALHLIKPLGFSLEDKYIRRSGLDYWPDLSLKIYEDYADFLGKNPGARVFMATTKAPAAYTDAEYKEEDFLMFGRESEGIPEEILRGNTGLCVRVPMAAGRRSLNLSNAVAVVLYEALRQQGFKGLCGETAGVL